jgi:DNA-binding response OmpR family regulator
LVVDDDEALRKTLAETFVDEHRYTVVEAATLADADKAVDDEDVHLDAIILDICLPDGDGFDYCTRLRKGGFNMPIIILTGSVGEEDVVRGLSAGANDYVAKPFRVGELAARLMAQLLTFDSSEDAAFVLGRFVFRPSKKQLRDVTKKRVVRLTDKEVGLLKFLHRAEAGVDREVLLTQVWGYNTGVSTHTLETHIYHLRQKIEANPASPTLLVTVAGGYRLNESSLTPTQQA